jgi:urease accessory protein
MLMAKAASDIAARGGIAAGTGGASTGTVVAHVSGDYTTGRDYATGRIDARFSCVRGVTQLTQSYCAAPLKIAKTFPLDGSQIGVCVMDCSPGLLAGDHYEFEWRLEEGAQVFLTNQAFTRIHPSLDNPCHQRQQITVADGALLEYLPEPVMLFRDANFRNDCEIRVQPGGVLLMSDILCAGRVSRGEVFQFASYHNQLRVYSGDELIFCNQARLCPRERDLRTIGSWESYTHWGNFYIFAERVRPPLQDELVQRLRYVMEHFPMLLSGVSLTYRHGIIVSMLGRRAWDMQQAARRLREEVNDCLACRLK